MKGKTVVLKCGPETLPHTATVPPYSNLATMLDNISPPTVSIAP